MVLKDLDERGLLFAAPRFEHSYPFCWRCDTPLIYYARSSWFIAMTKVKDRLIDYNRRINWIPETIKEGRMGNFLENVIDWGISRERYWGTPLPVWVCDKCGKIHVVGSRKELSELTGVPMKTLSCTSPMWIRLTWKCECGGTMRREPEVIDCWFDSGSMPFAQWHYPFENKDKFQQPLPRELYQRGHRPDPRLVLYPFRHSGLPVRFRPPSSTASCWATFRIRKAER